MIDIIDFSNAPLSQRDLQYAGRAGEKRGIIYHNSFWFLKFPKNTIGMDNTKTLSYVTSPLSEYIGSHIFQILGYDVHETLLGVCFDGKRNKVVCACKDFIDDDKNELLIPYTALRNDTNEQIMRRNDDNFVSASNLNEILFQLDNNTILKNIKNAKERFWDTVVIDILINNNDRNEDNWGVIKYKKESQCALAPIFDNGNCFYSKTDETRIKEILNDSTKLYSSATNGITAYEDNNEKRILAKDIIKLQNNDLICSIRKVLTKVNEHINDIEKLFNDIPNKFGDIDIISNERKEYYLKTLKIRMEILANI